VHLAGVARALRGEADAFLVVRGDQPVAQQRRGDVGKLQPARGDGYRDGRGGGAVRGLLFT